MGSVILDKVHRHLKSYCLISNSTWNDTTLVLFLVSWVHHGSCKARPIIKQSMQALPLLSLSGRQ